MPQSGNGRLGSFLSVQLDEADRREGGFDTRAGSEGLRLG